ncbi:MAG: hypothetical protein K8823_1558 [Cenarchaeum symbiont of Oopsacas minuta]|nr:hypothetical protein [Cenarchaeum symbiont of Oopsacas minuta]
MGKTTAEELDRRAAELDAREKALDTNSSMNQDDLNKKIDAEVQVRVRDILTAKDQKQETDDINDPAYDDAKFVLRQKSANEAANGPQDPPLSFPTKCCGFKFKTDVGLNAHRMQDKKCPKGAFAH